MQFVLHCINWALVITVADTQSAPEQVRKDAEAHIDSSRRYIFFFVLDTELFNYIDTVGHLQ